MGEPMSTPDNSPWPAYLLLRTWMSVIQTRYKEVTVYDEGGGTLEQVAQRGGRCPVPGNTQGQVGRGSEQPGWDEDVPALIAGELD